MDAKRWKALSAEDRELFFEEESDIKDAYTDWYFAHPEFKAEAYKRYCALIDARRIK